MKFQVDRAEFQKAISRVEGIISAREIRSVISNILVEAQDGKVTLTTTDLEIGIKTSLTGQVQEPGAITLPAKKLSQTVREFRSENMQFNAEADNRIMLMDAGGQSRAHITLIGAPADEYPRIPSLPDKKFTPFPAGVALEMMKKTGYAVAEEDARYVFNGLYIINKGTRVAFVGTDGRRLSKVERDFPEEPPFASGIILPNKAVKELQKLLDSGADGRVAHDEKERRVYFRLGDVDLITKLIEGQYPDYQQVIPRKLDTELVFNRVNFEHSLRTVSVMASETSRQVRFTFSGDGLRLSSQTPDLGEAYDTLDVPYTGEEMTIAFNSHYVMDIIRVLDTEEIRLSFSNPSAPAVIRDPGDQEFVAVIMPMKI